MSGFARTLQQSYRKYESNKFQRTISLGKNSARSWLHVYRDSARQLATRRNKVKAMLLLLRWSGLRIGDAIKLERSKITGNKLLLRMEKTGAPVFCPLPPEVIKALDAVENENPRYYFWTGKSTARSAYGDWHRTFKSVFKEANLDKPAHPHMLRDTFAVEMLLAGVPIEQVSILLGHQSVKTTERHYAPWVLARQEQLEASVQKAWALDKGRKAKAKKSGR